MTTTMLAPEDNELVDAKFVAARLHCSDRKAQNMLKSGEIPGASKVAKKWMTRRSVFETWFRGKFPEVMQ